MSELPKDWIERVEAEFLDADGGMRDRVYVIESPSPEDMLEGRSEGEALTKTLRLAEIDVVYFLAVNAEMFERAFREIGEQIPQQADYGIAQPFIHLSGHGSDDGLELTDGDVIYWEKLTSLLQTLHETVGPCRFGSGISDDVPKATVCLSACGVFEHYLEATPDPRPYQGLVGPIKDVGWCEALIAYSTFYYQVMVLRKSVMVALLAMNIAAGSIYGDGEAYHSWNQFDHDPELRKALSKMVL